MTAPLEDQVLMMLRDGPRAFLELRAVLKCEPADLGRALSHLMVGGRVQQAGFPALWTRTEFVPLTLRGGMATVPHRPPAPKRKRYVRRDPLARRILRLVRGGK